ncbi:MAG TPA: DUF1003 domain-containing protein [Beijerinckiaceae bacterium]|jgi:uncharacterized membrane protein
MPKTPHPHVPHAHPPHGTCAVTGRTLPERELVPAALVRPPLIDRIRADHPGIPPDGSVSRAVLAEYRGRLVEELLHEERGEITDLEREVVESLRRHETIGRDVESEFDEKRSFGERVSDRIAEFGGSWTFILSFFGFLVLWMAVNVALASGAFDPYPFILLNLVLSCLAAIQAPIIMMSQKRQEARDRLRGENDYQVNLKAELEIRHLHEKIDHLLTHQWERLAEIQQIQVELLQELTAKRR